MGSRGYPNSAEQQADSRPIFQHLRYQEDARRLFQKLRQRFQLHASRLDAAATRERVAASILLSLGATCVCSQAQATKCLLPQGNAGRVSRPWSLRSTTVLPLVPIFQGLRVPAYIQCSPWVLRAEQCEVPLRTCTLLGVSTLQDFRAIACAIMHAADYDCKVWKCTAEASEDQVAVDIASSGRSDLVLVSPNGKGLERHA